MISMSNALAAALVVMVAMPEVCVAQTSLNGDPKELGDCGPASLFTLLALSGHNVDLNTIRKNLPPLSRKGYSMAELSMAARSCGFPMDGVRIVKIPEAIDRVMIIRVDTQMGHFIVIRPVGHTGKLVQIIDPVAPTRVVDKAYFLDHAEWDGLALIPSVTRLYSRWAELVLYCIVIGASCWLVLVLTLRVVVRPKIGMPVKQQQG